MFLPPTNSVMSFNLRKLDGPDEKVNLEALFVDRDFLPTMGIELLEGQSFEDFQGQDEWKILLNRKAVDLLGKENPIGEKMIGGEIIGIFRGFNIHSLHQEIPPMMIIAGENNLRLIVVRYEPNRCEQVTRSISQILGKLFPGSFPEINRMEDVLKDMYRKEWQTAVIVGIFTFIAVIIGGMGLFGMSMHMLQSRRKEFAVRKVNGAGTGNILWLIARNCLVLILVSLILASPLALFLLERWLRNFALHVSVSWWIFAVSGGLSVIIVAGTVGYHMVLSARTNPVTSLRYE
jgi:putative ABC transport system permease protein